MVKLARIARALMGIYKKQVPGIPTLYPVCGGTDVPPKLAPRPPNGPGFPNPMRMQGVRIQVSLVGRIGGHTAHV